jgi:hypothetical protein
LENTDNELLDDDFAGHAREVFAVIFVDSRLCESAVKIFTGFQFLIEQSFLAGYGMLSHELILVVLPEGRWKK